MSVMGICTAKNNFSYCILEGSKSKPELKKEGLEIIKFQNNIELTNWYSSQFYNLIKQYKPEKIGIKLSLDACKENIPYWYYPLGILYSLCSNENIIIKEFTPRNFTPLKFGLDKDIDIYEYIDNEFPNICRKKKNQHYAFLSAWIMLS